MTTISAINVNTTARDTVLWDKNLVSLILYQVNDPEDLDRLSQVCRLFNQVINTTPMFVAYRYMDKVGPTDIDMMNVRVLRAIETPNKTHELARYLFSSGTRKAFLSNLLVAYPSSENIQMMLNQASKSPRTEADNIYSYMVEVLYKRDFYTAARLAELISDRVKKLNVYALLAEVNAAYIEKSYARTRVLRFHNRIGEFFEILKRSSTGDLFQEIYTIAQEIQESSPNLSLGLIRKLAELNPAYCEEALRASLKITVEEGRDIEIVKTVSLISQIKPDMLRNLLQVVSKELPLIADRVEALVEIGKAFAANNDISSAEQIVNEIDHSYFKTQIYIAIAKRDPQYFETAVSMALTIAHSFWQADTMAEIVRLWLTNNSEYDQGIVDRMASHITDPVTKTIFFMRLTLTHSSYLEQSLMMFNTLNPEQVQDLGKVYPDFIAVDLEFFKKWRSLIRHMRVSEEKVNLWIKISKAACYWHAVLRARAEKRWKGVDQYFLAKMKLIKKEDAFKLLKFH